MSQLSKPYQYALVGIILLAGAWMLVLKPSDDVAIDDSPLPGASAPVAPGVEGLSTAVDKAQGAVDSANAATAARTGTTGATTDPLAPAATTTSPGSTTEPASKTKTASGDPSRPILDAIGRGKVAVVLFYEQAGADDRAIRRTLGELPRHGGRVKVFSVPIADVGRYAAITRGVSVLAAPTVLVIGADRTARSITGYTEVGEINQLVGDALKRAVTSDATPAAPGVA